MDPILQLAREIEPHNIFLMTLIFTQEQIKFVCPLDSNNIGLNSKSHSDTQFVKKNCPSLKNDLPHLSV